MGMTLKSQRPFVKRPVDRRREKRAPRVAIDAAGENGLTRSHVLIGSALHTKRHYSPDRRRDHWRSDARSAGVGTAAWPRRGGVLDAYPRHRGSDRWRTGPADHGRALVTRRHILAALRLSRSG